MTLRVVETVFIDTVRPNETPPDPPSLMASSLDETLLAAAIEAVPDALAAARALIKSKDTPAAIKVDCIKLIFDAAKPKGTPGTKPAASVTPTERATPWEDIVAAVRATAPPLPTTSRRRRRAETESA